MRLGILSDAHGNLAGFEACIAGMRHVDRVIFAGDLLGYYFDPRAILQRLRELDAICLAGNHDLYFLAHLGRPIPHPIQIPGADAYRKRYGPSLEMAASVLTAEEIDWIAGLPCDRALTFEGRRVRIVHGSPWRPADEYVYPDDPGLDRFDDLDADLIVMGHTHRPFVWMGRGVTLLNAGSCGQPRDGDPRASYAIADITRDAIRCDVRREPYDRTALIEQCRRLAPESPLPVDLLIRESRL